MPTTFVTADIIDASNPILTGADDADYYIAKGVLIGSETGAAILLTGSFHDVWVHGDVFGEIAGIALGFVFPADSTFCTVTIAQGASVQAEDTGVTFIASSSRLTNEGAIHGGQFGVQLGGTGSVASVIQNRGTVSSGDIGIAVAAGTTETVRLVNAGTVAGANTAYRGFDNLDLVTNRGVLQGVVFLDGGDDVLDNRGGEILGVVDLGDGADRLDNRGGQVTGTVLGGAGNDTFLPGAGAEDFNGGAGSDTLDFRGSVGLRVSLADDSGTGLAEGDVYLAIEHVMGSLSGADTLIGSVAANVLRGHGGADTIFGGAGGDVLDGGTGIDRLTGGAGNDRFQILALGGGADLLTDFSAAAAGNDDRFEIRAGAFGGGLVAGATLASSRFRARVDNLAQDGDDRFIFRTTDATLWFDSNGSAAGGLSLIADLQASATMTAVDILLI